MAAILGLGVILLRQINAYRWLAASLLILTIIPITLVGFWPNGHWGISDWDYYFSYHHSIRRLVLEYGIFPQWNPYICGGTSAIGDPEFPLLAPTFVLELIFGVPTGLRLAIFAAASFGAIGTLLLAKRLGLKPAAALMPALVFTFSSVNLLEIVEGHPNVLSAFYLPWIFWAWLAAYGCQKNQMTKSKIQTNFKTSKLRSKNFIIFWLLKIWHLLDIRAFKLGFFNWVLLCGFLLAATFMQGGIYMLMYVGLAFLFFIAALPNRWAALRTTLAAGSWALGLAAIKLVPVILWLRYFPDKAYASSTYLLPSLHKILLGRYPHGSENILPNQGSGWHEYGAYIGLIALGLALLSLLQIKRKKIQLLWLGAALAILLASAGPLLKPLFDIAPYLPRSNISRFMIMAILTLGLLAGFGLQSIKRPRRLSVIIIVIIIAGAAFELTSYAAGLSRQAFVLTPVPALTPPPPPIAYTINEHITRLNGIDYTRAWASAAAGYGTMSYCSVLGPDPSVRVIEDPEGNPYLNLPKSQGTAELISWSPQRIIVKTRSDAGGELILNSNFAPGWQVNNQPAQEIAGRLTASIPPGEHVATFQYQAPGLAAGLALTALTLLAASVQIAILLYHKIRQRGTALV